MPTPAPERQNTFTMITPIVGDLLVTATKVYDTAKDIPPYGTPMSEVVQLGAADRFKDHVFIFIEPQKDARPQVFTCYFAAPRENEDTYNWEFTAADIGDTKFDAVSRTYIIPREEYNSADPAMGSAMPNVPEDLFPPATSYILALKGQRRLDKTFDGYFVIETRVYVKKESLTDLGVDDLTGRSLYSTTTLYHKDEIVSGGLTAAQLFAAPGNAFWGMQPTGIGVSGRQLSTEFYSITNEQVVSGTFVSGGVQIADYFTTEDYFWPAVLSELRFFTYSLKKGGGSENYIEPVFSREQYRGPSKARIQMSWRSTPHTVSQPQVMRPLPVQMNTPFFGLDAGTSLHGQVEVNVVISNHPKYEASAGTYTWGATTPTDWPASLIASDEQRQYKGGWLRTTVTMYPPSFT